MSSLNNRRLLAFFSSRDDDIVGYRHIRVLLRRRVVTFRGNGSRGAGDLAVLEPQARRETINLNVLSHRALRKALRLHILAIRLTNDTVRKWRIRDVQVIRLRVLNRRHRGVANGKFCLVDDNYLVVTRLRWRTRDNSSLRVNLHPLRETLCSEILVGHTVCRFWRNRYGFFALLVLFPNRTDWQGLIDRSGEGIRSERSAVTGTVLRPQRSGVRCGFRKIFRNSEVSRRQRVVIYRQILVFTNDIARRVSPDNVVLQVVMREHAGCLSDCSVTRFSRIQLRVIVDHIEFQRRRAQNDVHATLVVLQPILSLTSRNILTTGPRCRINTIHPTLELPTRLHANVVRQIHRAYVHPVHVDVLGIKRTIRPTSFRPGSCRLVEFIVRNNPLTITSISVDTLEVELVLALFIGSGGYSLCNPLGVVTLNLLADPLLHLRLIGNRPVTTTKILATKVLLYVLFDSEDCLITQIRANNLLSPKNKVTLLTLNGTATQNSAGLPVQRTIRNCGVPENNTTDGTIQTVADIVTFARNSPIFTRLSKLVVAIADVVDIEVRNAVVAVPRHHVVGICRCLCRGPSTCVLIHQTQFFFLAIR